MQGEHPSPRAEPDLEADKTFSFGAFRFDSEGLLLFENGSTVLLGPKPLAVLKCLLERPGEVVSKQHLIDTVWHEISVTEDSLGKAVNRLRHALADDLENPVYIQTIHRRGYRFIAPVRTNGELSDGVVADTETALPAAQPDGDAGAKTIGSSWPLLLTVGGVIVGAVAVAGLFLNFQNSSRQPPAVSRFQISAPPGWHIPIQGPNLGISSDGSLLAYEAQNSEENASRVFVRSLGDLEARQLPMLPSGGINPRFSPDNRRLVVVAGNDVSVIPLGGEAVRTVCEDCRDEWVISGIGGATWGPDDTIVFAFGSLKQISSLGGTVRVIASPERADNQQKFNWPSMLPGGKAVLATMTSDEPERIVVASLDSGETRVIVENGTTAQYVPTGHLIFARDGELLAAPFDLDRLEVTGPAVTVVRDVMMMTHPSAASFAVSDNGTLVYQSGEVFQQRWRLGWADEEGNVEPFIEENRLDEFRFSPDGQRLAARIVKSSSDIWIYDIRRSVWDRLTDGAGWSQSPIWSPDGSRVAFASKRDGTSGLYVIPADGSGPPQRILEGEDWMGPTSWSPDGQTIAFHQNEGPVGRNIWMVPADGSGAAELFQQNAAFPAFSPDGRWVAFGTWLDGTEASAGGLAEGVHIVAYPDASQRFKASDWGWLPRWSADGRELYYHGRPPQTRRSRFFAVSFEDEPEVRLGVPRQLAQRASAFFDVAPDGRFAIARWDGRGAQTTDVNVVLNWFEELKQRVPTGR